MGQKVNPISNRLGIIRGWDSNWFGGKNFGDNIVEDSKIRKYLNERLANASLSRIIIERTLKLVTIAICTARPGIVIGKGGQDVDKLREELKQLYKKDIQINIYEVKKPELDASIVAENVARQVEGKVSYRRAMVPKALRYRFQVVLMVQKCHVRKCIRKGVLLFILSVQILITVNLRP